MEQKQRLGGWQFWVDVYDSYVIKTPKSRSEIKDQVEKFLRWKNQLDELEERTDKMLSDVKESTQILEESKIPRKLLADLEFIKGGKIRQKRVLPLGEYLKDLSEKSRIQLIDKIMIFLLDLWSYGIHEKTFKVFSNLGIDVDELVLIDAFEVTSNKDKVLRQIKKRSWAKPENYKKHLSKKDTSYLFKKLDETLTEENLNAYWKSK